MPKQTRNKEEYSTDTIDASGLIDEEVIGKRIIGWFVANYPEQEIDELVIELDDGGLIDVRLIKRERGLGYKESDWNVEGNEDCFIEIESD